MPAYTPQDRGNSSGPSKKASKKGKQQNQQSYDGVKKHQPRRQRRPESSNSKRPDVSAQASPSSSTNKTAAQDGTVASCGALALTNSHIALTAGMGMSPDDTEQLCSRLYTLVRFPEIPENIRLDLAYHALNVALRYGPTDVDEPPCLKPIEDMFARLERSEECSPEESHYGKRLMRRQMLSYMQVWTEKIQRKLDDAEAEYLRSHPQMQQDTPEQSPTRSETKFMMHNDS